MIPAGAIKTDPDNVQQLGPHSVLTIIKEPTDALLTSWFQYQVHELKFSQPQHGTNGSVPTCTAFGGSNTGTNCDVDNNGVYDEQCALNSPCNIDNAFNGGCGADGTCSEPPVWKGDGQPYRETNFATGLPGDIVVLQKDNCSDVNLVSPESFMFGTTHSARFTLSEAGGETEGDEKGGTAKEWPLAVGKVNELDTGIYKICYATMSSGGESEGDFKELGKEIEILPPPDMTPSLSAPRSVILGQDVVVSWASNIGLQDVTSGVDSWLGLFKKDSCLDTHECWVAYQFISARELTGTVIFSSVDYKFSGEYEVRYFKGNTRNGQGMVCRGQPGVPSETYVTCQLEAAATSEVITVAGQEIDETEDISLRVGLEAVFGNGNRRVHHTRVDRMGR